MGLAIIVVYLQTKILNEKQVHVVLYGPTLYGRYYAKVLPYMFPMRNLTYNLIMSTVEGKRFRIYNFKFVDLKQNNFFK